MQSIPPCASTGRRRSGVARVLGLLTAAVLACLWVAAHAAASLDGSPTGSSTAQDVDDPTETAPCAPQGPTPGAADDVGVDEARVTSASVTTQRTPALVPHPVTRGDPRVTSRTQVDPD